MRALRSASLGARLAAAGGLALVGFLVLGYAVFFWRVGDDPLQPTATPSASQPAEPCNRSARYRELLAGVFGNAVRIAIATAPERLLASASPRIAVLPGGELRVVTPPPRPDGPIVKPWPVAGVLVPRPLAHLQGRERSALLAVLIALAGGRVLDYEDLHVDPADATPAELRQLLQWQR